MVDERVEEIRQFYEQREDDTYFSPQLVGDLLTALAQAEREREENAQDVMRLQGEVAGLTEERNRLRTPENFDMALALNEIRELRAEVERLRGLMERRADTQEMVNESVRSQYARAEQAEADLAREKAEVARLKKLVLIRLPHYDTPEWEAKESELIAEANEMTDIDQVREHYVCATLNWSSLLDERDVTQADLARVRAALPLLDRAIERLGENFWRYDPRQTIDLLNEIRAALEGRG